MAGGAARSAGGRHANHIPPDSRYAIGPFQGSGGRGLFRYPQYPPEDAVLLDALDNVRNRFYRAMNRT